MTAIVQDSILTFLQAGAFSIVTISAIRILNPVSFCVVSTFIQTLMFIFFKYICKFSAQLISPILLAALAITFLFFSRQKLACSIIFFIYHIFYMAIIEVLVGVVAHIMLRDSVRESALRFEPYFFKMKFLVFIAYVMLALLFLFLWQKSKFGKIQTIINDIPIYLLIPLFFSQFGVLLLIANNVLSIRFYTVDAIVSVIIVAICFIGSNIALFITLKRYLHIKITEKNKEIFYQSAKSQLYLLEQMVIQEKALSKFNHDLKNQIQTVYSLMLQGETKKGLDYIQRVMAVDQLLQSEIYCSDQTINAILNQKATICHEYGIHFLPNILLEKYFYMDPLHLCSLFGNILDNAISACKEVKMPGKEPTIILQVRQHHRFLLISCKNPYQASDKTTEVQRIHWGLDILRDIAEMYQGQLKVSQTDETYCIRISLVLDQT